MDNLFLNCVSCYITFIAGNFSPYCRSCSINKDKARCQFKNINHTQCYHWTIRNLCFFHRTNNIKNDFFIE